LGDLSKGEKSIDYKWIFKKRYNLDQSITNYKIREVAKGFTQNSNINYFDTFAPITRNCSIRVLLYLPSIS